MGMREDRRELVTDSLLIVQGCDSWAFTRDSFPLPYPAAKGKHPPGRAGVSTGMIMLTNVNPKVRAQNCH
jgi:hypothetical protein